MMRSMSRRSRISFVSSSDCELVELVAVSVEDLGGGSERLVGEVLDLLVPEPAGRLRRALVDRAQRGHLGAHRVLVDHVVRDLGDPLEVVRGARGDRVEHELLGSAAAEEHRHEVDQLLAGLQVAILLGEVQRVAQRAAVGDDRDPVHAIDGRQQLAAQRVARLVVGDDPLLVIGQRASGLHAGDDALERAIEVLHRDRIGVAAGGEDRGLIAEVGQVGSGQPRGLASEQRQVDGHIERLVAGVDLEDPLAADDIGRRDEDLAVKAAGAQQRRVELVEQVGGRDHDDFLVRREAVHLDEQLVERLVTLAGDVKPAMTAHGVELVDEHDRRRLLARGLEQAADPGGPQAGEHLDERGGGLGEERGAGLVGDGFGKQRLAGARRAVQKDALGDLGPDVAKALGVSEIFDDLSQLILGLIGAGDLSPARSAGRSPA